MTDTTLSGAGRWKLRISAIAWFVLLAGFLLCLPVLFQASVLVVLAVIALAAILALFGAWLVRRLFTGQRAGTFLGSYAKAFLALLFVLTILLAAPLYFLALRTELRPLVVPQATLSNGSKTVVFQGMVHVGGESFYKSVVYDIEKALSDGYTIYYEGVLGDPAGDAWFSQTLAGGGDLNTSYQTMGSACGLNFQLDYFQLLVPDMEARPEIHVKADVSTADMMHEYERLVRSDPDFAAVAEKAKAPAPQAGETAGGGVGALLTWLQSATAGQRELIGTACRGWVTMLLSNKTGPSPLDPVILDFRNRKLAERIAGDTHDKIYVTYGSAHLPGLLADLQASDPAWEIKSIKWMRVIEEPEELSGTI